MISLVDSGLCFTLLFFLIILAANHLHYRIHKRKKVIVKRYLSAKKGQQVIMHVQRTKLEQLTK